MERNSRALVAALWPLSVGHLLAMLLVLLPFALLVALVEWQRQIQVGASLLVIEFQHLPAPQSLSSTGAGADTTDATGALVLRRGDRAWHWLDARADLSRPLSGLRSRQRPRGGKRPHQCQSRHCRPGLCRPLGLDDRGRRILGLASLPLSGSQVRVEELVQSGYDLGRQFDSGGRSCARC